MMKMKERYSRQILLSEIGEEGQKRLLESTVAIIGCGATGSVVVNNLTRAGIGKIFIVDRDFVEKQRRMNSDVETDAIVKDLNHTNAEKIMRDVNIVLDGTDNMQTRFAENTLTVYDAGATRLRT